MEDQVLQMRPHDGPPTPGYPVVGTYCHGSDFAVIPGEAQPFSRKSNARAASDPRKCRTRLVPAETRQLLMVVCSDFIFVKFNCSVLGCHSVNALGELFLHDAQSFCAARAGEGT